MVKLGPATREPCVTGSGSAGATVVVTVQEP